MIQNEFRQMRRAERKLSENDTIGILKSQNFGVLSVVGDGGHPYGVPVNYAFYNGKIYFHSTQADSHKLDAIRQNSRVCFTVVSKHDIISEEYSTNYESVIVFGSATIIDGANEKAVAMKNMMSVLCPDDKRTSDAPCGGSGYVMVEITPEHITGKSRNKKQRGH